MSKLKFLLISIFRVLVSNQADLVRMHEIIPMSQVNLLILKFNPYDFFNKFIAPTFHDLNRVVKLAVEYPKKDEAFITKHM